MTICVNNLFWYLELVNRQAIPLFTRLLIGNNGF
jgi:hypothetical protein